MELENKKIFLTGATGFIGRHLAQMLAEKNHVTALVQMPCEDTSLSLLKSWGVSIIKGDLLDPPSYNAQIKECDYVFHLAALFDLDGDKKSLYEVNVEGSRKLAESCSKSGVKKFLYFSTAYVVTGTRQRDGITENEPYSGKYRNWYEWSKAEAEKSLSAICGKAHLPLVIIRPTTVYGPGSTYGWYLALWSFSYKRSFLSGDGSSKIHFVHVLDVTRATAHLACADTSDRDIFFVCDDAPYTQKESAGLFCQAIGVSPPRLFLPKWFMKAALKLPLHSVLFGPMSTNSIDYYADNFTFTNSKLKSTGFSLKYPDIKQGIPETIDWYLRNGLLKSSR